MQRAEHSLCVKTWHVRVNSNYFLLRLLFESLFLFFSSPNAFRFSLIILATLTLASNTVHTLLFHMHKLNFSGLEVICFTLQLTTRCKMSNEIIAVNCMETNIINVQRSGRELHFIWPKLIYGMIADTHTHHGSTSKA